VWNGESESGANIMPLCGKQQNGRVKIFTFQKRKNHTLT
jgi:hypothetical protein